MTEHAGAGRVRRFMEELSARGVDALPDFFTPDVAWHVGAGNPEPGSFHGLEALVDYYRRHRISGTGHVEFERLSTLESDSFAASFLEIKVEVSGAEQTVLLPQLFRNGPDGRWSEYWILQIPERTASIPKTEQALKDSGFLDADWYYAIELVPGVSTPGKGHLNFGLTRGLLSRCDVEGRRCLDIGTMEGAVPILLSRRGAGKIVGVDVMACDLKVAIVKNFTGARFEYHSGLTHPETVPFVRRRHGGNFDLVVFSGVMYHTFGPLHALAVARSLVRTGGLMIVETAAAADKQHAMFFNTKGRFSPDGSTYFLTAVPLLEYLLRYFKLKPLDCAASQRTSVRGSTVVRVAIACRAVNELPPDADPWMRSAAEQVDYNTLIAWDQIDKSGSDPPAYGTPFSPFVDPATGICDVVRTVNDAPAMHLPPEVATIRLSDQS